MTTRKSRKGNAREGTDRYYRLLVEEMGAGMVTLALDGTILYSNRRFSQLLQTPVEQLLGASIRSFVAPIDRYRFDALLAGSGADRWSSEILFQIKDGDSLPVLLSLSLLHLDSDPVICMVVTDLSRQKRQEGVIASQELARAILEQTPEAILICDQDGIVIRASFYAHDLCGQNPTMQRFDDLFVLERCGAAVGSKFFSVQDCLRGEVVQTLEVKLRRKDGTNRDLLLSASPLVFQSNEICGCVMTLTDITARKRAEDELARAVERLNSTLTSITDSYFSLDSSWRFIAINRVAEERIFRRPARDLIGKVFWEEYPDETRTEFCTQYRIAMAQGRPVHFEGKSAIVDRWFEVHAYPRDAHLEVYLRDITERKQAEEELARLLREAKLREEELREKQEQLIQAGKLATLGEMATGIAHELNNPLNNIGLFLGNLIENVERGEIDKNRVLATLRDSLKQLNKATTIISHLRVFGRGSGVNRKPCEVHQVIRDAVGLMQEQFRLREIQMIMDLCDKEPVVLGNPIQLEQVFINLLTNARDAVAACQQKRIRIATEIQADCVAITVQDSGPGIPPGLAQRIFDPFFTTKDVGQGTGLGLSITYSIIKAHEGSITVTSPPGNGATFMIRLPLFAS